MTYVALVYAIATAAVLLPIILVLLLVVGVKLAWLLAVRIAHAIGLSVSRVAARRQRSA
jgi:hypothetical protein